MKVTNGTHLGQTRFWEGTDRLPELTLNCCSARSSSQVLAPKEAVSAEDIRGRGNQHIASSSALAANVTRTPNLTFKDISIKWVSRAPYIPVSRGRQRKSRSSKLRSNSQWSAAHTKDNNTDKRRKQERLTLMFTSWISGQVYIIGLCVITTMAHYINHEVTLTSLSRYQKRKKKNPQHMIADVRHQSKKTSAWGNLKNMSKSSVNPRVYSDLLFELQSRRANNVLVCETQPPTQIIICF